jgi:hypothetical protein
MNNKRKMKKRKKRSEWSRTKGPFSNFLRLYTFRVSGNVCILERQCVILNNI